jgi:hypothetical protein
MRAIVYKTGAFSCDLRPAMPAGGTGVQTYRHPARLAIDNQGFALKEVVAPDPHS